MVAKVVEALSGGSDELMALESSPCIWIHFGHQLAPLQPGKGKSSSKGKGK